MPECKDCEKKYDCPGKPGGCGNPELNCATCEECGGPIKEREDGDYIVNACIDTSCSQYTNHIEKPQAAPCDVWDGIMGCMQPDKFHCKRHQLMEKKCEDCSVVNNCNHADPTRPVCDEYEEKSCANCGGCQMIATIAQIKCMEKNHKLWNPQIVSDEKPQPAPKLKSKIADEWLKHLQQKEKICVSKSIIEPQYNRKCILGLRDNPSACKLEYCDGCSSGVLIKEEKSNG